MLRYIIVSIISGFLFGTMDGLINANPFAQKLFLFLKPVARTSVNVPAGIIIDLVYGFAMAGIFMTLYQALPGPAGPVKGISFGLIVWFFRVVMYTASQWMTTTMPVSAVLYILLSGLVEMVLLGMLYGVTLKI
ncbi:MAG: hypothetical protein PHF84_10580 [bacterium]|nr:hypothetical protein [bacterium]